jgi:LysM repeat protein
MRKLFITGALSIVFGLLVGLGAPSAAQATGSGHVVQPGETMFSIAYHYGLSVQQLAAANGIYNPSYIQSGQRLTIPGGHDRPAPAPVHAVHKPAGGHHIVAPGDTLYSIAWSNGTTVSALLSHNGLSNPDYIYVGQRLAIPGQYVPAHQPASKACGHYVHVAHGDTLSAIAWRGGTTVYALASANGLSYPYLIYPGQSLHVPCGTGSPSPAVHKPAPKGHHPAPKHAKPAPKKHQPAARKTAPAACNRAVQIVQPHDHAHVSGTLHIVGTASVDDFQFYKLEYGSGNAPLDGEWISIGETVDQRVVDSTLGVWYVGNLPAGDYTLRLTAVYNTGQTARPCDVHLKVN